MYVKRKEREKRKERHSRPMTESVGVLYPSQRQRFPDPHVRAQRREVLVNVSQGLALISWAQSRLLRLVCAFAPCNLLSTPEDTVHLSKTEICPWAPSLPPVIPKALGNTPAPSPRLALSPTARAPQVCSPSMWTLCCFTHAVSLLGTPVTCLLPGPHWSLLCSWLNCTHLQVSA